MLSYSQRGYGANSAAIKNTIRMHFSFIISLYARAVRNDWEKCTP